MNRPFTMPLFLTLWALLSLVLPKALGAGPLSTVDRAFVREIRLEGNTVYSDADLHPMLAPYENRMVAFEELLALRRQLSQFYVDRGFINTGAVIPDQDVTDGVVVFRIIEGRLTGIRILEKGRLSEGYLRSRLEGAAGGPLNMNRLERAVRRLQQDPRIRRIDAELVPGLSRGESVLEARVAENSPWRAGVRAANDRSPAVGAERLEGFVSHHNLTGWGDALGASYSLTQGADEWGLYYRAPLNAGGTALEIGVQRNEAVVVETPFDRIDIESRSEGVEAVLSHPLLSEEGRELTLSLEIDRRSSRTFLLGRPYSFAPGVRDGKSDVTVLRFSQDWRQRGPDRALSVRSVFSLGVDALGATTHADAPDGRFFAWLGRFQWARRFERLRNLETLFRADLQLTPDPLLPMEKFSAGGMNSVRGYRENLSVRDNGFVASLEGRLPLFRATLPWGEPPSRRDGFVRLAAFFDWGWAENTDAPTPDPATISSCGLGLLWDPSSRLKASLYWGVPLRDVENGHDDLQEQGIHFQVEWRFL